MPKSERLFEMLRYIREYPHLTIPDLARLCNISERGIYRYIETLSRAGIPIYFHEDGYKLPEKGYDLLKDFDIEALQAVKKLLSMSIENSDDEDLIKHGRNFIDLIDANLPETERRTLNDIEILPLGTQASHYGGTITIGHSSRPDIMNPILTAETISVSLMNLIFSSLTNFDGAQHPVPDLAERWETSADGLVWKFFIRNDVTFHDGHPLTAHDLEFTYQAILDPANESPLAERYNLIDRIDTEGDFIFRVFLKHPFAPLIHRLNHVIAPKHLMENVDLHKTPLNQRPVGSGPFRLAEWSEDDTIVLEANREYFRKGRPIVDRLIFKAYNDRKAALQAIKRGKLDIAIDLAASDLLLVGKHGAFRVYSATNSSYYAIIFNLDDPLFRDIRVRKALDYAIDKESIVRDQLKGHSKICTGPFGVDSWAYNRDVHPTPFDTDKARDLLAEAGWMDTDGDGILDKDGKPLEISLAAPNMSDSLERIALAIKAQLVKVGIKVKLDYVDDSKLYGTAFQTILARMTPGADPDYESRFWHSGNKVTNLASYKNSFVDDLLESGRRLTDMEKRKAIYHEVHEIIHDDCPAVFLAAGFEFIGSNYRFLNAKFSSLQHFFATARDWQIAAQEKKDEKWEHKQEANTSS